MYIHASHLGFSRFIRFATLLCSLKKPGDKFVTLSVLIQAASISAIAVFSLGLNVMFGHRSTSAGIPPHLYVYNKGFGRSVIANVICAYRSTKVTLTAFDCPCTYINGLQGL